jgi:hypothetical protein
MVATALSLVATALLVGLVLTSTLISRSSSGARPSVDPAVAQADRLQAQQSLSTGLSTVEASALQAGGYAT